MVDAERVLVDLGVGRPGIGVVAGELTRLVGCRRGHQLHHLLVDGPLHVGRDLVVGERSPHSRSVLLASAEVERIVELIDGPLGARSRKVALDDGRGRRGSEAGRLQVVNELLVMGVEEGLVLEDGTTDGAAADVVVHWQFLQPRPVLEEVGRIQSLIPEVVPGMAVELVAPALGEHRDDRPAHAAVLGRVVVGDDLELLHRLRSRLHRGPLRDVAHVVGAVQLDLVGVRIQAVEGGIAAAVGVEGRVADLLPLLGPTRGQVGQLHHVAARKRKIQDLLLFDDRRHLGIVGVDDGGLSGDRHLLGDFAGGHGEIDAGYRLNLQTDPQGAGRLEAGQLRRDVIETGDQLVDDVVTAVVGHRHVRHVGRRGRGRDFHPGHHRSGLVLDGTQQPGKGGSLSVGQRRRQRMNDEHQGRCRQP